MDACRRRETDKLELTAKLSRKNAELQSENTNLSNKVNKETQIHDLKISGGFQQCGILTSVDSDEHVQPHIKLRNSKCCSVSSLTVIEYSSHQQRL